MESLGEDVVTGEVGSKWMGVPMLVAGHQGGTISRLGTGSIPEYILPNNPENASNKPCFHLTQHHRLDPGFFWKIQNQIPSGKEPDLSFWVPWPFINQIPHGFESSPYRNSNSNESTAKPLFSSSILPNNEAHDHYICICAVTACFNQDASTNFSSSIYRANTEFVCCFVLVACYQSYSH